jgi:hypothetical protein
MKNKSTILTLIRNLFPSLLAKRETFIGKDFNGRPASVRVRAPENDGPGYYEFEWLQDGYGVSFCGKVIRAASFRDAVLRGPELVTAQWHVACQYAFGTLPERVRRLPEGLQWLPDIRVAEARWKQCAEYATTPSAAERINPWRQGR